MTRRERTATLALVLTLVTASISACTPGDAEGDGAGTDVAVHVAAVEARDMHRYVTAYGYAGPAPMREGESAAGAVLTPLTSGVVAQVLGVEGARVEKGTVLARLDTRIADVTVQRAEKDLAFAERVAARQRQLLSTEGTSERGLQEAEQRLSEATTALAATRASRAYLDVVAPLTGTLTGFAARVGQAVDATTVLGQVVDLGRLVVTADVPATEARTLAPGARADVGREGATVRGTVSTIAKEVDPQTGTTRVTVMLASGSDLAPGEFTDLRIAAESHRAVLVVPEEAIVSRTGEGSWIMVVTGDSASRLPVTVGIHEGGFAEVTAPDLKAGTSVVTVEAYSLPERTRVHLVRR